MMGWLGKSLKKIENVDLKPRNIYISKTGESNKYAVEPKMTDCKFG